MVTALERSIIQQQKTESTTTICLIQLCFVGLTKLSFGLWPLKSKPLQSSNPPLDTAGAEKLGGSAVESRVGFRWENGSDRREQLQGSWMKRLHPYIDVTANVFKSNSCVHKRSIPVIDLCMWRVPLCWLELIGMKVRSASVLRVLSLTFSLCSL